MGSGGEDEGRLIAGELAGEFEVFERDGGGDERSCRWKLLLSGRNGESKRKAEEGNGGSHKMKVEALNKSEWRQKNGGKKMETWEINHGILGIHGKEEQVAFHNLFAIFGPFSRLISGHALRLAEHPFEFLRAAVGAVHVRHAVEIAEQGVRCDFAGVWTGDEPLGEGAG